MEKNKGFTLVELLAVIAILVILVLIAIPSVVKLFNESKKKLFISQAQSIFKATETQYLTDLLKG